MPNWADDEGKFHWKVPDTQDSWVEIPHPPISTWGGCHCTFCEHTRGIQSMVEVIHFTKKDKKPVHENLIYTGIGSRETPDDVLKLMARIGYKLAKHRWTLRSGHAPGADQAFEHGVRCAEIGGPKMPMEIYLPWDRFEGASHDGVDYFTPGNLYCGAMTIAEARGVAKHFHPAWDKCTDGARKLHTRNVFQVGGHDLCVKSTMVICWTKNGHRGGGTGQALRIAEHLQIPIFDLAICTEEQIIDFINEGVVPA